MTDDTRDCDLANVLRGVDLGKGDSPDVEPANTPPAVELTEEEKAAIVAVRKQSCAKAAAEKYLGRRIRAKVVRGYCCLFVGAATYTDFFGHTWQEAFLALVFRTKLGARSSESQGLAKAIAAAAPAPGEVSL